MKKVLILAYDFPPYVSVGGLRPYNWYKYLKEFGIEPIVITRQWDNKHGNGLDYIAASNHKETIIEESEYGTIIRTPYKPNLSNRLLLKYGAARFRLIRKLISAFYEIIQFLFIVGPKKELYKEAESYLRGNKVVAIIATGDPYILFFYSDKLSKKFSTPWIADYRDPWSQDESKKKYFVITKWNEFLEKRIMKSASLITTVSKFFEFKISSLVSDKKSYIFDNGFDHELINDLLNVEANKESLNIAFAGTIYNWHPWKSFISIYCHFIIENPKVESKLNFYGVNEEESIRKFIEKNFPGVSDAINFTPRIPNAEVLGKLAENSIMLLFNDYSIMGTKIFDYVGIKRKIILCYSDDDEAKSLKTEFYKIEEVAGLSKTLQADLIQKTNSGIVVKDAEHLKIVLNDLWQEFETTRAIACESVGIEQFSRKIQVEKLAKIISEL